MDRASQPGVRRPAPGGVATLWFDSPGRSQNVLDAAAFEELDQCLDGSKATPRFAAS